MAPVTITRAGGGQIDTELLQEKGFGVYCWYTGKTAVTLTDANGTPVATTDPAGTTPASPISTYLGETGYLLMRNQQVVWSTASPSTGSWQYSPTKYWPLDPDDMLTLRAYAPYTGYMVTDDKGMPQLPVVVSAQDYHNDTQHDPLWGTGKLVNPTTGEYYYPGTDPAGVEYPEGSSLVIDFKGKVIAQRMTSPVITADLSPALLAQFREKFPAWRDADPFTLNI